MQRTLQPELLDSLPPDHPAARHNRRDLRIINQLMRNHRWLEDTLASLLRPDDRVLEIGAGTGELGRRLSRRGIAVDGLDLWPRPSDWPAGAAWHRADLRRFSGYGDYTVVIGNLIFHQFSAEELAGLGCELRRSVRLIAASEPERRRLSQVLYRVAAPLLGANYVSRHDGHVSIAAGFRDDELPRALGLAATEWEFRRTSTVLGAHRLVAVRRSPHALAAAVDRRENLAGSAA